MICDTSRLVHQGSFLCACESCVCGGMPVCHCVRLARCFSLRACSNPESGALGSEYGAISLPFWGLWESIFGVVIVGMSEEKRRSVLLPVCAAAGSLAVLGIAGLVPVLGLSVGLGGGWYIGRKLRGGPAAKEEAPVEVEFEDSDDESSDDDTEGEDRAAMHIEAFCAHLQVLGPDPASSGVNGELLHGEDAVLIQKGLHEAFSQMPPELVEHLFGSLAAMKEKPPSTEEVGVLGAAFAEVTSLMPPEAQAAMVRTNRSFLPSAAGPDSTK
ncbi:unnamed protein product [Polarella glacialis]|uniref:Uncharacterized protein n=1 Tax=Polarella glacialis TaxID=89957 RepID=A0A813JZK3_POLGL|nr:unnamed protein product [Polarella glacialis]